MAVILLTRACVSFSNYRQNNLARSECTEALISAGVTVRAYIARQYARKIFQVISCVWGSSKIDHRRRAKGPGYM